MTMALQVSIHGINLMMSLLYSHFGIKSVSKDLKMSVIYSILLLIIVLSFTTFPIFVVMPWLTIMCIAHFLCLGIQQIASKWTNSNFSAYLSQGLQHILLIILFSFGG